ncbi:hypothetical protein [Rhizobium rhizogenes]|uniref:hypothetical protein n=1 Tax=Rhizobium rhizogenes TaxID=359 RepID=UPI002271ADA3|nr:hypothetical protein [Rhizobium rhizogenes]
MKFYRSRSFSFWMTAGSALFVACSVWIIGKSYRSEGMGSFDFFMGVSGGAFFLLTAFSGSTLRCASNPISISRRKD